MATIARALARVKEDYSKLLGSEAIGRACQACDHAFRNSLLAPVRLIHLFLLQILHGNTAISHLKHLVDFEFTESAYCQARQRLPLEVLTYLFATILDTLKTAGKSVGLWHGHRTFHIDGTGVSMPDTPKLRKFFGIPGKRRKGCGFPVGHLLAMFDAGTGLLLDMFASTWRTHDMSQASQMHPKLRPGDVLVGDRAFCSFAHLALLLRDKLHGLFRMHQRVIINFLPGRRCHRDCAKRYRKAGMPTSRWIKKLGRFDQLVEWFKPAQRPTWMTAKQYQALPESIILREFRYRIQQPGFRVRVVTAVTTLLDPQRYPVEELAELYLARWQIETNFRHLKITMKMDVLKCKTVEGVMKELMMFAMVYNLVRAVMIQAATQQNVTPQRISFIDALRWLCHALWTDCPLKLKVNPLRPGRAYARARKRWHKSYPILTKSRSKKPQTMQAERVNGLS